MAFVLGYQEVRCAVKQHVPEDCKTTLSQITVCVFHTSLAMGLKNVQPHTVLISEPGVYALVFRSKLKSAERFCKWVFSEVLPSIRMTGQYRHATTRHKQMMLSEFDLHVRVVNYIKKYYPWAITVATLGENQTTPELRVRSKMQGYQKGSSDLIIQHPSNGYASLSIEFKTPKGTGVVSPSQSLMLQRYRDAKHKLLPSDSYEECIREITLYMQGVRLHCTCGRVFKSSATLAPHRRVIHRL